MFGEHHYEGLPEELVPILVDNGVGEAQWQLALERIRMYEAHHRGRAPRQIIAKAMQSIGILGAGLRAILAAWSHTSPRDEGERGGNLRGTSFYNLPWESQVRGFKSARAMENSAEEQIYG